jgi:hypothetical protein
MYKLLIIKPLTEPTMVTKIADNGIDVTYIPMVEGNTDYQTYLKWLAEGNTPEPADQGE